MKDKHAIMFFFLIIFLFHFTNQLSLRYLQGTDESYEETDAEETDIRNGSEPMNYTDDSPTNSTSLSKLILVGFGNYQNPPERPLITFKIYFRRINTKVYISFVNFIIRINYDNRLRRIEEVEKNVTCPLSDKNEDNANDDNLQFDCSVPVEEGKEIDTVGIDDDSITFSEEMETVLSSYANGTIDDISTQTDNTLSKGIILLDSGVLSIDDSSFNISGTVTPAYNGQVIISLDANGNGNLKNVTCNVTMNDDGKTGVLQCDPKSSVKSHIDGASGDPIDDKQNRTFLISMSKDSDDLITLSSPIQNTYRKRKSGGLSTGSIVGIIIACVGALVAVGIVACLCRNRTIAPIDRKHDGTNIGLTVANSGADFKQNHY